MTKEQTKQSDAQAAMFGRDLLQPLIDKAAKTVIQTHLTNGGTPQDVKGGI